MGSSSFEKHLQAYYKHPQAVLDCGAGGDWLAFVLHGDIDMAGGAADTARRILLLRERHRTAITAQLGGAASSGHKVLESLFDRRIVAVSDVQQDERSSFLHDFSDHRQTIGPCQANAKRMTLTGGPCNATVRTGLVHVTDALRHRGL